jgi:hypothetical protein
MPDFLMTRQRAREYDVLLVEAKFRTTVWLRNAEICGACEHKNALHIFTDERLTCDPTSKTEKSCLHCVYHELVEFGKPTAPDVPYVGNILFYLIARSVTIIDEKPTSDRIFLNLAFKPKWWSRTRTAGDFSKRPEYRGTAEHPSFLQAEEQFIQPALNHIFSR